MNNMKNNSGRIVQTHQGEKGKIYNGEQPVNGKFPVYLDNGEKKLCKPQNLTTIGYFD